MADFTPGSAIAGGVLIGVAASLVLLTHGKVAGVSGLYGGLLRRDRDWGFRVAFVAGLVVAGLVVRLVAPAAFATAWSPSVPTALAAGVLVGFGTRLGGGCTSGHGVCGVSRLSVRSLLATAIFMATGFVTVFFVRHVFGGPS
jgi:hypothetical protein